MRKLTLIFLFFLSSNSFAQNFFITSNFGLMGYGGDLEPKAISLSLPHSTYSFGLTYELSRHIFINSLYTRGMIEGNDAYTLKNRERNLKFKSKINEFSIGAEYDFLDLYNLPITPFVQANFSVFHFNPFLEEGIKKYYLRDYHTEGQGFLPNVPEYSLTQFAVPLGVGFKIAISENIKAGLLLSIRKTFTDYLDDCSANYVDSVSLHKFFKDPKQGDLATHLAYRKNLLNKDLYYSAAVSPGIISKRGDPTNNDNFFTLGLTLSIRLGKKYSEEMDFEKNNKINVSCPKKNTFVVPKINLKSLNLPHMPSYKNLEDCLKDLEKNNQLIRIKEEVDANLEMAAIHLRVFEAKGPALLFENIKGTTFRAASNIFGTVDRSKFIFRDSFKQVQDLIELKNDPIKFLKKPFTHLKTGWNALHAIPLKNPLINESSFHEIKISDLPLIKHWKLDGGAFVTLPQVYTEDVDQPGIMKANLGMYRIQLDGNNYTLNEEIGLHYQLHRGIGVHQKKANRIGKPLKVSIFVGGPPSHSVAAVMPLPEGMSEMTFAGVLGGRRFRYKYVDGYCISLDADFVITGQVFPNENKPEGPFGDHLGYYSLQHPFPLLKVHKVFAKKNAIWPFTVVGRPPQEDTSFGDLIHALTGNAVKNEIPGLKEINAVDAAGVHPLLLAIGSERYTPYSPTKQPAELLTIANHVLGTGQLSLAKFLFITADESNQISTNRIEEYLIYIFERIRLDRDIHFYTKTTIDTLDYSGESLNSGSKVVLAAYGNPIRKLTTSIPEKFNDIKPNLNAQLILPGVVAIEINSFTTYENAILELTELKSNLQKIIPKIGLSETLNDEIVLFVICDDANYICQHLNNFLWITFTRCNPSHDIYGVYEEFINKHWNCFGSLILDARIKKHHAPILEKDPVVEENIEKLFKKGGSLYGI